MRILWITNKIFPVPCRELGIPESEGGGWILSLAQSLVDSGQIKLAIASLYPGRELNILEDNDVIYYLLPAKSSIAGNSGFELEGPKICEVFQPDLIHIHGTEYSEGINLMRALPEQKYVISIQGLVSIYERYYYGSIRTSVILRNITLRDIVKRDTLFEARRKFRNRGIVEREYISIARNVIGRTTWDFVHAKSINPEVNYYFCNENLRKEFYNVKWNLSQVRRHSIFASQGTYPIKGLHMLIHAFSMVRKVYNDAILLVAGPDITKPNGNHSRLRISGYGKYIRKLIAELSIEENIIFCGTQDVNQMADNYIHTHVFVCPSSIENSPNSLGEAQLVGTPCIATYVGGIPDMVQNEQTTLLYRFEEYEMLAQKIIRIFGDDDLAQKLSRNGRIEAAARHDWNKNANRMLEIYNQVTYE